MKFTVIVARYAITGVPLARQASTLALLRHEVDLIIGFVTKSLPVQVVKDKNKGEF